MTNRDVGLGRAFVWVFGFVLTVLFLLCAIYLGYQLYIKVNYSLGYQDEVIKEIQKQVKTECLR